MRPRQPRLRADVLLTGVRVLFAAACLAAFGWALSRPINPNARVRQECRDRYSRAASRADTTAIDLHPVRIRQRGMLVYCYQFRLGTTR